MKKYRVAWTETWTVERSIEIWAESDNSAKRIAHEGIHEEVIEHEMTSSEDEPSSIDDYEVEEIPAKAKIEVMLVSYNLATGRRKISDLDGKNLRWVTGKQYEEGYIGVRGKPCPDCGICMECCTTCNGHGYVPEVEGEGT